MQKNSKKQKNGKKSKYFGKYTTIVLALLIIFNLSVIWALFISGPSRIHEQKQEDCMAAIQQEVPAIQGLSSSTFAYITWQGYTQDTLYWFDALGQIITTRQIDTLDYNKARQKAADTYEMETDTIQLAFGYTRPVYELQGSGRYLLLDYDTLEVVYERLTDI